MKRRKEFVEAHFRVSGLTDNRVVIREIADLSVREWPLITRALFLNKAEWEALGSPSDLTIIIEPKDESDG